MQAAVIVFPASNREGDIAGALERVSGRPPVMVWHREQDLPKVDLIVLPGGFAHGDYLRCGAMAARAPVMSEVRKRAAAGVPVLGVCNGFQVLTEAGLLPGALVRNAGLRFVCKPVTLRVERSDSPLMRGFNAGQVVTFPVAHGEGNFIADTETVARLEGEGRVAFRYCAADGQLTEASNVNGSTGAIAGVLSENRRVLGLMPHPENASDPETLATGGSVDGHAFFAGIAAALS